MNVDDVKNCYYIIFYVFKFNFCFQIKVVAVRRLSMSRVQYTLAVAKKSKNKNFQKMLFEIKNIPFFLLFLW
jgi:hypothetical protein